MMAKSATGFNRTWRKAPRRTDLRLVGVGRGRGRERDMERPSIASLAVLCRMTKTHSGSSMMIRKDVLPIRLSRLASVLIRDVMI